VGRATTQAVVAASVTIFVLDLFLSMMFVSRSANP
jgi:ABC-type transporter Mla maintaining outer membrane lipid asymmetry permease subunit MlaE